MIAQKMQKSGHKGLWHQKMNGGCMLGRLAKVQIAGQEGF